MNPSSSIWDACEAIISCDLETRKQGLSRLIENQAAGQFNLAAYILVTRITEPDISLRTLIVKVLGDLVDSGDQHNKTTHDVRQCLFHYLSQMRTRQIYALIQVAEFDPSTQKEIVNILGYCPFAGGHLIEIIENKEVPIRIRHIAAICIESVGYLDAIPKLERVQRRMQAGMKNNKRKSEYTKLIATIQSTLESLKEI
jgi:hypothetical protein